MTQAIRSIILEAEAMAALADANATYLGYANDIAQAGKHLLDVIGTGIASAAHKEPISERFDLSDLVERACAMVALRASDKRIGIMSLEASPVFALGDARATLQILVNLLTNSVKFTPEGGRITLHLAENGNRVTLDVADNGPGVPDGLHARIFAEFERTPQSDGLGLGLPISRSLAQGLGGDLELVPSATGACFRLTLAAG